MNHEEISTILCNAHLTGTRGTIHHAEGFKRTMQRRTLLFTAAAALLPSGPRHGLAQRVDKYAEQLENGEFNWFPERSPAGPILIIVSIPDQLVHVYRNGVRIAASTCSTGKPGHRTPTGVFEILQKDKHHRSSTYSEPSGLSRLAWLRKAAHAILGTAVRHHPDGDDGGDRG